MKLPAYLKTRNPYIDYEFYFVDNKLKVTAHVIQPACNYGNHYSRPICAEYAPAWVIKGIEMANVADVGTPLPLADGWVEKRWLNLFHNQYQYYFYSIRTKPLPKEDVV